MSNKIRNVNNITLKQLNDEYNDILKRVLDIKLSMEDEMFNYKIDKFKQLKYLSNDILNDINDASQQISIIFNKIELFDKELIDLGV